MNFFFDIRIPYENKETNPHTEILKLSYGVITKVQIVIPDGHKGLAHLVLKYHESQLYPLSRGEDYHGDGIPVEFEDMFPLYVEPYELKAIGWSESVKYAHSFLVSVNVLRPEELGYKVPDTTIKAMEELIGYKGEL